MFVGNCRRLLNFFGTYWYSLVIGGAFWNFLVIVGAFWFLFSLNGVFASVGTCWCFIVSDDDWLTNS